MDRIKILVRPDQMETMIAALRNAADDERQTAEIVAGMRNVDDKKERLEGIRARQDKYARTAAWLEHIWEEAETGDRSLCPGE